MEANTHESDIQALLQHAAWLRKLAGALVGESGADDLAQDTWVAALSHRVDSSRPLQPWLRRVATNFSRRTFRRRERQSPEPPEEHEDSTLVDPAELTERLENESLLTDALSGLEEPFRSTLYLHFYEGLQPKQIAERTKTRGGTVRWRLKRGLELMRERLDKQVEGGRSNWIALLLPVAGLEAQRSAAIAAGSVLIPGTTTLFGVLAMSTLFKLLVAITASVALYVGLDAGGYLPNSLSLADDGQAIEVEFHPLAAPLAQPSSATPLKAPPTGAPQRSAVTAPSISVPVANGPQPTRIVARVTDEDGLPLQGASISEPLTKTEVLSDEQGHVVLPIPAAGRPFSEVSTNEQGEVPRPVVAAGRPFSEVALLFAMDGRATRSVVFDLPEGSEYDLGEIQLEPGGVISGRVVDAHGDPVRGATITWMVAETPLVQLRAMRFQHLHISSPSCTTDQTGSFRLAGVPTGQLRLWAAATGYEAQFTAPVAVRAGYESRGGEIVLPPLKPENRIRVRVIDPDHEPVPYAKLSYQMLSNNNRTHQSGLETTDHNGFHEFIVPDDTQLQVSAADRHAVFGVAAAENVETARETVTLQLTKARLAVLTVQRGDGQPALDYAVEVRSADGLALYDGKHEQPDAQGRVSIRLPATTFQLHIEAPLAEILVLGPLDPDKTESLSAKLRELPGLHGRVTVGDEGLAGANVTLHPVVSDDEEYSVNGFRCLSERGSEQLVLTDEEGRFVLTVRKAGKYVVRAEATGYAAADTTPFSVGPDLRGIALELVLGRGGVLEGEVRTAGGESPMNTIVGISRGDGFARTMRVGRDGKFRFERLTPGPWRVVRREHLLREGSQETSTRSGGSIKAYDTLGWDCEVFEGQSTYHVLELGEPARWSFEGRFTTGGASQPWTATLQPAGSFFAESGLSTSALDVDGRFSLPVDKHGKYQLVLHGEWSSVSDCFLVQPIDSAKDSPWQLDLAVGDLQITGAAAGTDELSVPPLALLHDLGGGAFVLIAFGGDENGEARLEHTPAGKSKLVQPSIEHLDPKRWPVLREIEVVRGGSTRVQLNP